MIRFSQGIFYFCQALLAYAIAPFLLLAMIIAANADPISTCGEFMNRSPEFYIICLNLENRIIILENDLADRKAHAEFTPLCGSGGVVMCPQTKAAAERADLAALMERIDAAIKARDNSKLKEVPHCARDYRYQECVLKRQGLP